MLLRKFSVTDLEAIKKIDSFYATQIKYHKDIKEENILTVINDSNELIGIAFLKLDRNYPAKGKQLFNFSILLKESLPDDIEVKGMLIDGLIKRLYESKETIPEKKLCLRICCETDQIEDMQFFLEKGFALNSVVPVLKYDLLQETKHYDIPSNVIIKEYSFTKEGIKKYINADLIASGIPESEADIKFKTGDPSFKCFVATCNKEVVGAISVWNITEQRAATENIFVIPSFRRKNIARELIATAFDELKRRGKDIATLSMSGTNVSAMKLYLSCGYILYYNLIEMVYDSG